MKVVPLKKHSTPQDVRDALDNALAHDYPIIVTALRPSGEWELSYFLPPNVSGYEAAGALAVAQHRILYGDDDAD